jgi:hypothetical protein
VTPLFEHHSASRDRLEGCYSWLRIELSIHVCCPPVLTNRLTGVGRRTEHFQPFSYDALEDTQSRSVVYPFYHPRLRKLPNGI